MFTWECGKLQNVDTEYTLNTHLHPYQSPLTDLKYLNTLYAIYITH